jgi:hypothetical protein
MAEMLPAFYRPLQVAYLSDVPYGHDDKLPHAERILSWTLKNFVLFKHR